MDGPMSTTAQLTRKEFLLLSRTIEEAVVALMNVDDESAERKLAEARELAPEGWEFEIDAAQLLMSLSAAVLREFESDSQLLDALFETVVHVDKVAIVLDDGSCRVIKDRTRATPYLLRG